MTPGGVPSGAQPVLQGLQEVYLPSGVRVRVMLPSLRHLIRHGLLPTHLHEAALRGGEEGWLEAPDTSEERQARVAEYLYWLVAWSVREIERDGEWVPVRYTAAEVTEWSPDDVDILEDVALRDMTPMAASIGSRILRLSQGQSVPDEIPDDDGEAAIPGWSDFRGERRGTPGDDDGAPVADAAEPAAVGGG